jgi:hypothetical protein
VPNLWVSLTGPALHPDRASKDHGQAQAIAVIQDP